MKKPKAPPAGKKAEPTNSKRKKPEFENRVRTKNAKKIRERVASFKLRSEQIMKRPKEKKKERRPEPRIERRNIRIGKKPDLEKPQRRTGPKIYELRVKTAVPTKCSMVLRKTKPEAGNAANTRPAARILQRQRRPRLGEIIFKLGF
jgi:hypothetical protein